MKRPARDTVMGDSPAIERSIRGLIGAGIGLLIGTFQYAIDVVGMHRAAHAPGFNGVGIAFESAVVFALVTITLMLLACGLLRFRLWPLSAIALFVTELCAAACLWPHAHAIGLRGDQQALLFVALATLICTFASIAWPARTRS